MKILVVDDDPEIVTSLRAFLDAEPGIESVSATSGKQGLALAATTRPDLILLDVRMPDLDGLTVCQQLRLDPVLARIPVIMLTACQDVQTAIDAFSHGAADYLPKPVDLPRLMVKIRETVERAAREGRANQAEA
ncbi:MAG: response regulator [Candidatus Riflebacteria bacterium]|nr:response regulator [Candidatus Riflebacteria bacterium]